MVAANNKVLEQFKAKTPEEQRETLVKTLTPIQNDAPVYVRMLNIAQDPTTDSVKLIKVMEILLDAIEKYTTAKKVEQTSAAEVQQEKSHAYLEKLHQMELKEKEEEDLDALLDSIEE